MNQMRAFLQIFTLTRYDIVPIVAPASPAFVIGVQFFRDLVNVQNWNYVLAFGAAITLALTIELGGMFVAKSFTDFWARGDRKRMILSLSALGFYGYFGISLTWGTSLWPVFLFVTFLYLVIASRDTQKEKDDGEKEAMADKKYLAKEGRLTANANARAAKFHGSARENGVKKLEINEGVKLYLDGLDDPGAATIEQMQNATGLSAGAVSKHRKRYINQ